MDTLHITYPDNDQVYEDFFNALQENEDGMIGVLAFIGKAVEMFKEKTTPLEQYGKAFLPQGFKVKVVEGRIEVRTPEGRIGEEQLGEMGWGGRGPRGGREAALGLEEVNS